MNNFPAFQDPSVYSIPNSTSAFADMFSFVLPVKIPAAKMPITDFMSGYLDILYYAYLEFGTPPQKLSVDIDTGSADLWVASNCTGCNVDQFDPLASNTSQALNMDFTIEYVRPFSYSICIYIDPNYRELEWRWVLTLKIWSP